MNAQLSIVEANGQRGIVFRFPSDDAEWNRYAGNMFRCIREEIQKRSKAAAQEAGQVVASDR